MAGVDTIKSVLVGTGVLAHVIVPPAIDLLLKSLEISGPTTPQGDGIATGAVTPKDDLSETPIPGFDFALTTPPVVGPAPYKLKVTPSSFQLWLQLADQEHLRSKDNGLPVDIPTKQPATHLRNDEHVAAVVPQDHLLPLKLHELAL
ncbi:hypothetical protein [Paraburkholderia sp. RL17-337-BIB-A]|uniref:hypothetical protein n=1 Tax=Paraburkholderia sp. RL17-337-BIB-A TaxID=3031636 RepID=UPI0038BA3DC9